MKTEALVEGATRQEYGCTWRWCTNVLIDTARLRDHWRSMSGSVVRIFPPDIADDAWEVAVFDDPGVIPEQRDIHTLTGSDAENRAFAIAEGYTRQDRSS